MSSSSESSDWDDPNSIRLDDRVLLDLLRSLASFNSLEEMLLHRIITFVPTRRYAPMPKRMAFNGALSSTRECAATAGSMPAPSRSEEEQTGR